MKRTTARGLPVLGAAALVAIALAACGGGGSTTTSTTSKAPAAKAAAPQGATSAGGAPASRTALVACLKKYGVKLPSFGGPGGAGGRFGFGATGATGRRFGFGASGATGRRFGFGATGATGRRLGFGATGARGRGGFPGGGFASNPKLAQALQKCGGFGGGFGGAVGSGGRTGAFSTQSRTELTSFVACMKKHGETLPNPNLSGSGSVFGNVNQTTASFKTAYAQCKGILTYLNRRPAGTGAPGPATG
jgi:hypothetical protein